MQEQAESERVARHNRVTASHSVRCITPPYIRPNLTTRCFKVKDQLLRDFFKTSSIESLERDGCGINDYVSKRGMI